MKTHTKAWSVFFLCVLFISSSAWAEELSLSVKLDRGGRWITPVDKKIIITSRPQPFQIVIHNHSDSSIFIYSDVKSGYDQNIYLEMRDSRGKRYQVKHRPPQNSQAIVEISRPLKPGGELAIDVLLDPTDWSLPQTDLDGEDFWVRAVYNNGIQKIVSQEYKVSF